MHAQLYQPQNISGGQGARNSPPAFALANPDFQSGSSLVRQFINKEPGMVISRLNTNLPRRIAIFTCMPPIRGACHALVQWVSMYGCV